MGMQRAQRRFRRRRIRKRRRRKRRRRRIQRRRRRSLRRTANSKLPGTNGHGSTEFWKISDSFLSSTELDLFILRKGIEQNNKKPVFARDTRVVRIFIIMSST